MGALESTMNRSSDFRRILCNRYRETKSDELLLSLNRSFLSLGEDEDENNKEASQIWPLRVSVDLYPTTINGHHLLNLISLTEALRGPKMVENGGEPGKSMAEELFLRLWNPGADHILLQMIELADGLEAALGVNYDCQFTGDLRLFSDIIKLQKSQTNFDHAIRKRDCNEANTGPDTQLLDNQIATRLSISDDDSTNKLDRMPQLLASYSVVSHTPKGTINLSCLECMGLRLLRGTLSLTRMQRHLSDDGFLAR